MDIGKNIADILQLYEFSMTIGKSLDYRTNCDNFLKTLLARKNFSACCIVQKIESNLKTLYCYPTYKEKDKTPESFEMVAGCFSGKCPAIFEINRNNRGAIPFKFERGIALFFPLNEITGLFLFDEVRESFSDRDLNQLLPIIEKFKTSLEACEAYGRQNKLLKKLEVQNQELMDYAQVVSHDLKSPLRNINTIINWIKEDSQNLDSDVCSNLKKIEENLEKMDNLIDGILQYSVIDKKDDDNSLVNVDAVLREIINTIDIPQHIDVTIDNIVPPITIDLFRFKQLFQNLISNAVTSIDKPRGNIIVKGWYSDTQIIFSVSDNGKGIEKKYYKKIFEIFKSLDITPKSTGLGLAIVKKIVEYYNGTIDLTSQPGIGTTFTISLDKHLMDYTTTIKA